MTRISALATALAVALTATAAAAQDNDRDHPGDRRSPPAAHGRPAAARPNVAQYRRAVQAQHRYHFARPWAAPRGYAYRRFALGERIPPVLLVASFFIPAYATYGLAPPPGGYVWVRNGADAVLVDQATGEVIQVQYGLFD